MRVQGSLSNVWFASVEGPCSLLITPTREVHASFLNANSVLTFPAVSSEIASSLDIKKADFHGKKIIWNFLLSSQRHFPSGQMYGSISRTWKWCFTCTTFMDKCLLMENYKEKSRLRILEAWCLCIFILALINSVSSERSLTSPGESLFSAWSHIFTKSVELGDFLIPDKCC